MTMLTRIAMDRPHLCLWGAGVFSLVMILLVAVPTLAPQTAPFLAPLKIDTDPENMLSEDEPVRVFHNEMKRAFDIHDLIVVGVVDATQAQGVFTKATLNDLYTLTQFARTIRFEEGDRTQGVIAADIIAPSTVDSIEQAGLGAVRFDWLLPRPPETEADALVVRDKALRIPTLNGTLVSGDGQAIALYIPIARKDISYRVAQALREKISAFDTTATYHITGLPIAQDQFGVEMFKQMALSAPAAMVLIFVLMWIFFRNAALIVSPMIVALVSVIGAMGFLIATGNTVHIMSSMIPIFVMPIAVLDAVHMLSDFYDRYREMGDRRTTLNHVMQELWTPMLFTTLTTCIGFASLAFAPIPPVQVFGIFVALGVFLAWFFTMTLVPAFIMVMPEKAFERFGMVRAAGVANSPLSAFLRGLGRFAYGYKIVVILILAIAMAIAGYGMTRIEINDNPVKWFATDHPIRVADDALNARFAGTYMAYLTLTPEDAPTVASTAAAIRRDLEALGTQAAAQTLDGLSEVEAAAETPEALITDLVASATARRDDAVSDADWEAWDAVVLRLERAGQQGEVFKRPDVLRYMAALQTHLNGTGLVGKSNALPDLVKTVHRDLFLGAEEAFRIPDTVEAVAQTLITFQNSHKPQDLFKLVTPDYGRANLWIQLKSGDNRDMNAVVDAVARYMAATPPPVALTHDWFGLTYINTVWQQKMVRGMAVAFAGSFVIVLVLMTILFRSFFWGLLSMAPLTVTIAVIYGVIGLIGKDYDMPIAVLSSLSLGLAVDYAIHFNARSRQIFVRTGSWAETVRPVFGEPARAIFRNVIVIGVGFLPLLLAPLVPYQTVGIFISAILLLAGAATLFGLPALITLFEPVLFPKRSG